MNNNRHMRNDVYELVPQWFKEAKYGQYLLTISDDIDSLATASLLQKLYGWEINKFYDFEGVYVNDIFTNEQDHVGIDIAFEHGLKTIDNHVTLLTQNETPNPNSVNMNNMYKVSRQNYTDKYAMSTLLTAWSLVGKPIPQTDEGKMILLSIDSSYKGHYNSRFRPIHNEWLRKLGFEEFIPFLDSKTPQDFWKIQDKYRIGGKIWVKENGQLETNIDLESVGNHLGVELSLPQCEFYPIMSLVRKNKKLGYNPYQKTDKIYTFALTYKDTASYSVLQNRAI